MKISRRKLLTLGAASPAALLLRSTKARGGVRVSVMRDDPGYCPAAFGSTVFLDGVPMKYCYTADERTDEIWCHATDANGKILIDYERGETHKIRLTGDVRVVFKGRG